MESSFCSRSFSCCSTNRRCNDPVIRLKDRLNSASWSSRSTPIRCSNSPRSIRNVASYKSWTEAVIVRLSRIANTSASNSIHRNTTLRMTSAMRITLLIIPPSELPKSCRYSNEGREVTSMGILSCSPLSQSVTATVEGKRTRISARFTPFGVLPPEIQPLDLRVPVFLV